MLKALNDRQNRIIISMSLLLIDAVIAVALINFSKTIAFMKIIAPFCLLGALGLKCGLCGGTHSVMHLVEGDISSAFQSNLLIPIFLVVIALVYFIFHLAYIFNVKWALNIIKKHIISIPCFLCLTIPFILYGFIRSAIIVLS